jgi:hypothetical protein
LDDFGFGIIGTSFRIMSAPSYDEQKQSSKIEMTFVSFLFFFPPPGSVLSAHALNVSKICPLHLQKSADAPVFADVICPPQARVLLPIS